MSLRRHRFVRPTAVALAVTALMSLLLTASGRGALRAQGGPESVTVQLLIMADADGGLQIALPIGVAGGAPANLRFDTGSTGLRIFAGAVGTAGLQKTTQSMSVQYGDGTVFEGVLAHAPAVVAGVATGAPIAFHLVESVSCGSATPDCPGKDGIAGWDPGFAGVAGVGLRMHPGAPDLVSVLAQLPGALASGWTIDTGGFGSTSATLTLGLTAAGRAGFATTQLAGEAGSPATFTNGVTVWDDRAVPVCFTVGGSATAPPGIEGCWPTTFDTGAEATILAPEPSQAPSAWMTGHVYAISAGEPVRITLQGVFDVQYSAGMTESENAVLVTPSATPSANTGIQFFFRFAMLFDPVNGLLGFKPLS